MPSRNRAQLREQLLLHGDTSVGPSEPMSQYDQFHARSSPKIRGVSNPGHALSRFRGPSLQGPLGACLSPHLAILQVAFIIMHCPCYRLVANKTLRMEHSRILYDVLSIS